MTEQEIHEWIRRINKMTHIEMAKLWRFAPSGHPVFDSTLPLFTVFEAKFNRYGGMTPTISKKIGW